MTKHLPKVFEANTFFTQMGHGHSVSNYSDGDVLFAQGEPATDVFFITSGEIRISVVSRRGKEAVVSMLPAGSFCGEGVLRGQLVRISTATAVKDCLVASFSKALIVRLLKTEPTFSEFFISHLISRNIRIEEDLVDQLFNSSEKRLARALLLMANFGKDGTAETVIPDITQEVLAEMVGTTRSRVSFFMNKFRKLGFIEYNGKLHIHSSLLNVVLND